jgi:hypothetical protein
LIGISNTTAIANMVALINAPATTTTEGTALAAADIVKLTDTYKISAAVVTAASAFSIKGIGAGRLTLAETAASGAWTLNKIHCYYGKKGAIDLVVQDLSSVDMRETADRRGTNVFSSYLAGLKTFQDGSRKFLNVLIAR